MKRIISTLTALMLCLVFTIPQQQIHAKTNLDILVDAFGNLMDSDYRSTGKIRIAGLIEDVQMDIGINSTALKVNNESSSTIKFDANLKDDENFIKANGTLNTIRDQLGYTFFRISDMSVDMNDREMGEAFAGVNDLFNLISTNTYFRSSFEQIVSGVTEGQIDPADYEIMNMLQESGSYQTELIKKFLQVLDKKLITITKRGNNYTIKPVRSISMAKVRALENEIYSFFKNDLGIEDIEAPTEYGTTEGYKDLNEILSTLRKTINLSIVITVKNEKISRIRVTGRSLNANIPLSVTALLQFSYRTPKKVSMPRCYIDIDNPMGILDAIEDGMGSGEEKDVYMREIMDEIEDMKVCR